MGKREEGGSGRLRALHDPPAGRFAAALVRGAAWFRAYILAGTAFLLLLLWGGVALYLSGDKAQTTARVATNVANLSQVVDEHITRLIFEVDRTLVDAKRRYEAGSPISSGPPPAEDSGSIELEIVDAAGYVVDGGDHPAGAARPYRGALEAFAVHRETTDDRLFIGKPILTVRDGKESWRIPLSRRLAHGDGSFAGVVLATVSPEFLGAVFEKLDIGGSGFIAIVGRDDLVIRARSSPEGVSVPQADMVRTPLRDALKEASAGAFADDGTIDGTPRIVGYRELIAYPLIIVIGVSRAEILAPYFGRRSLLLGGAGMLTIVFIGAGLLLIRQNTHQLRAQAELHRQSEALVASRREAERANAAAQAADRAKTEFLANMSHELRTPLNAVIGFSEAMSAELFGPLSERYRDYADSIHGAGRHLMQILNDILDLSKIEAGRFELHDEPIGVGEVFDSCRRLVAERALSAGVKLQFAPSELGIRADPLRLKQVLLNLLSNAIKFTPSGGSVTVDAGVNSAGSITIQVRDSGIGMRPEDIPLAFEPFGQVDNSLTRSQQGTGLGLPLVRRLVELHGGEVCLSSAPGQGTTVTLTFPPDRTLDPIQAEAASDNG